jgi:arabinan endo-1,5-alpha-L-arabinosidase
MFTVNKRHRSAVLTFVGVVDRIRSGSIYQSHTKDRISIFSHHARPWTAAGTAGLAGSRWQLQGSWICIALILSGLPGELTATAQPRFTPPPPLSAEEAARQAQLGSRGVRVHDPSTIAKCKDEYWIFYTGRDVRSYRSKDLLKWEVGPVVFSNSPPWVAEAVPANRNGRDFWAPDVIRVGDRYLLYFSVSSFGKNTSAIGLATNPTLDPGDPNYKWTDQGLVIQSSPRDDFNAIDPALFQDSDGSLWMSFGSFWGGIKMIELDPKTGKRIAPDSTVYALARYDSIEAPFIFWHDAKYFLFVNWGFCCRGTNSTYEIRVGRSDKVTGPYRDREGKDLLLGGGTKVLSTEDEFIGPGHAGILREGEKFWFGFHFYNGAQRGTPTFAMRPMRWGDDGWPVVEKILK